MRIAYVTVHVAPEIMQGGVGKKIKSQIKIWREEEYEVTLFSLTPSEIPFPSERQFIFNTRTNLLMRELNRAAALTSMIKSIQAYKPELIYLRYGLYSYPLHQIFGIAPVILETNSNDKVEYATRGPFFYWTNLLTRNLIFGFISGMIAPSRELETELQPKRNIPTCVISNGVDINEIDLLPPTKNSIPVITLVGSPGMNWHGVDKLIGFAEKHPDIAVNIVGYSTEDIKTLIPVNVTLHGFLSHQKLREVLLTTDVACGTLALHRKNMEEACPLKVREALACGIPVVIAYYDTDLNKVNSDTFLHIPNTENNVMQNAERIHKFAYDMIGKRVDFKSIAPYLDQRQKETARLAFFEKILNQHGA